MNTRYPIGSIVFENWVLERVIGSGGYGVVYEARREEFGKVYKSAIKIMTVPQDQQEIDRVYSEGMDQRSVYTYFQGIVENLVNEVDLMARFKGNSNIVSYEDHRVVQHSDGIGWDILIRMELLTPFTEYLKYNDFRTSDVIRLGIDICNALELCKNAKVIHRDVKQGNLFVSERGDFKLGDFGVARVIEHTMGITPKQGTEQYMAPEVRKEESYGHSVDIYSLGIVLYILLNDNRMPFLPDYPQPITFTDRQQAEIRRISGEPMKPPRNASEALGKIILKACAYRPEDRYESPAAMRNDLRALLVGGAARGQGGIPQGMTPPVTTKPYTTNPPETPKMDKKKVGIIAGACAAVIVICVLLLTLLGGRDDKGKSNSETAIQVEVPEMMVMGVGDDTPLPYTVHPKDTDQELTWTSSNEDVIHVVSGTLIAREPGEAMIQVGYEDSADQCRVLVVDQDLGGELYPVSEDGWFYTIDGAEYGDVLMVVGGDTYLYEESKTYDEEAMKMFAIAAKQELGEYIKEEKNGWASVYEDEACTKLLGYLVLAEAADDKLVYVVHKDQYTYVLNMEEVVDPATVTRELKLNKTELKLEAGEKFTLKVEGIQEDDSVVDLKDVTWSSSDKSICKVKDGVVTAVSKGKAEITVTYEDLTCTCTVKVTKTVVEESSVPEESSVQEESSYVQEESSYVQEESSYVQEESSYVQEESSYVQEESSYLPEESSSYQEESSDYEESEGDVIGSTDDSGDSDVIGSSDDSEDNDVIG